ncbi:MAG: hypothetical protein ACK5TX_13750 [Planctomyces sp.]|jgi:hypothetical protein
MLLDLTRQQHPRERPVVRAGGAAVAQAKRESPKQENATPVKPTESTATNVAIHCAVFEIENGSISGDVHRFNASCHDIKNIETQVASNSRPPPA